jgi:mannose-1-phosphate guanylyltransferase
MKAVLLVGGAGTRIRPLTYVVPKCMLPVGGKPLIERTFSYLKGYGVDSFVLCVAYLKKQIMDYIKDGSEFGVTVQYAQSEFPLGTAGQLKTAEKLVHERFLLMNGDILTNLNINNLLKTHEKNGGVATIAVKKFQVKVPYGHITVSEDSRITRFEEKPTLSYTANAGVYVVEPLVFSLIPSDRECSIEREIFPSLLEKGYRINAYYEDAFWADIGTISDFENVNDRILSMGGIIPSSQAKNID